MVGGPGGRKIALRALPAILLLFMVGAASAQFQGLVSDRQPPNAATNVNLTPLLSARVGHNNTTLASDDVNATLLFWNGTGPVGVWSSAGDFAAGIFNLSVQESGRVVTLGGGGGAYDYTYVTTTGLTESDLHNKILIDTGTDQRLEFGTVAGAASHWLAADGGYVTSTEPASETVTRVRFKIHMSGVHNNAGNDWLFLGVGNGQGNISNSGVAAFDNWGAVFSFRSSDSRGVGATRGISGAGQASSSFINLAQSTNYYVAISTNGTATVAVCVAASEVNRDNYNCDVGAVTLGGAPTGAMSHVYHLGVWDSASNNGGSGYVDDYIINDATGASFWLSDVKDTGANNTSFAAIDWMGYPGINGTFANNMSWSYRASNVLFTAGALTPAWTQIGSAHPIISTGFSTVGRYVQVRMNFSYNGTTPAPHVEYAALSTTAPERTTQTKTNDTFLQVNKTGLSFGTTYRWMVGVRQNVTHFTNVTGDGALFSFITSGGASVFFESDPTVLVTPDITGVLVIANNVTYTRNVTGGLLNLTGVPVSASNTRLIFPDTVSFYSRRVLAPNGIAAEGRFYVLDKASTAVSNTFTVRDYTGGDWTATPSRQIKIFFDRFLDSATRKVTGDFLDINNGFSAILQFGACYSVWLESPSETRTLGEYCAAASGAIEFNIGLVIFPTSTPRPGSWISTNVTPSATRAENGTITLAFVVATYNDSRNATTQLNISVLRLDRTHIFVSNMTTNNSQISFSFTFNVSNESVATNQYLVLFNWTSDGVSGVFEHPFDFFLKQVGNIVQDIGLPARYAPIIGLFLLIFIALFFSYLNVDVGILVTGAAAGLLTLLGFLSIQLGTLVLIAVIGFLASFRLRRVRQEGAG